MNLKKANPVVAYNIHNEYHLRRCIAKASIPWCWCSQDILDVCSMYSSSVNAQQPQAANSADGVDSADITPEQTTSVGNQNIFTTGAGNVCGNKTDTRHVYMVHATIAKKHPGCTGEMWVMTNDAYIPDILEFVIVNEWFVIPVTPMGHTSPTQRKMVMEELGCSCVDSDDEDEDEDEDEDDEKPGSIKNDIRRHESRMYNAKQAVENEAKRRGKNAQQQNDQQTDEWESVKLALNAMLIRYTMSNPETKCIATATPAAESALKLEPQNKPSKRYSMLFTTSGGIPNINDVDVSKKCDLDVMDIDGDDNIYATVIYDDLENVKVAMPTSMYDDIRAPEPLAKVTDLPVEDKNARVAEFIETVTAPVATAEEPPALAQAVLVDVKAERRSSVVIPKTDAIDNAAKKSEAESEAGKAENKDIKKRNGSKKQAAK
ncbi:hypothetical protein V5799_032441 [Amblyomma americanum]|uniref:Uncharacterized protein n=1 Tax=Amblyomma americanum TaxID=6943 RepID=A0AAQ4DR61_AMBAM